MRLFFIRHAQSTNNALWMATKSSKGRSEDPDLSELGYRQAAALAHFVVETDRVFPDINAVGYPVRAFGFTHLYCSLMHRSVATAYPLAKALGISLTARTDMCEYGGIYLKDEASGMEHGLPGKPRSFFQEKFPDIILPDGLNDQGWWNRPKESETDFHARVNQVCNFLLATHGHTDDCVAFVSHGDFYQGFMTHMLGLPYDADMWFGMKNCGVTRLDITEKSTGLIYANRVDYLGDLLV